MHEHTLTFRVTKQRSSKMAENFFIQRLNLYKNTMHVPYNAISCQSVCEVRFIQFRGADDAVLRQECSFYDMLKFAISPSLISLETDVSVTLLTAHRPV